MKKPERPALELANYQGVYDFYGSEAHATRYDGKQRRASRAAHYLLGQAYGPRLNYDEETQASLGAMVESDTPALVLVNHVSNHDPNVVVAAMQKDVALATILRRSGLWAAAKDSLFRLPLARRYFDSRQLVPVFRPKNYSDGAERRLLIDASTALNKTLVSHLERGSSVALFPEGQRNLGDPTQVLKIGNSAAKIALQAMELRASDVDMLCIGINYGSENHVRGANVHIDHYAASTLPDTQRELRQFMQVGMQSAVDQAVTTY